MKNLILTFAIVGVFFSSLAFIPNHLNDNNNNNDYNEFLKNLYLSNYQIGNSLEVTTVDGILVIHEIFSKNDSSKLGYIAVDTNTNEPLYFGDINKNEKTVTIKNFKSDISEIYRFSMDDSFEKFYELDILNEIKSIDFPLSQDKMFGSSCGNSWSITGSDCYETCCHYFFWVQYGCEIVGC